MNRTLTMWLLLGLTLPIAAAELTDTAEVIAATPIYSTINEPREECWQENVQAQPRYLQEPHSYWGAAIGGISGGLLGAQIGDGSGQVAASAVGAVLGALLGDRIDNRPREIVDYTSPAQTVERCRSFDNHRQTVTGYTVLYRYQGREAQTVLPYHPGSTLRIGIGAIDAVGGQPR